MYIFQKGRTILELIAVLAVIGVLSIGAVAGFRLAMNHHEANQILNDVRLLAADIIQREEAPSVGAIKIATDFNPATTHPYSVYRQFEDLFYVQVDDIKSGVCQLILSKTKDSVYEVFIVDGAGTQLDNCPLQGHVQFYFGNDYSLCEITCESSNICVGGTCCAPENACGTRAC